MNMDTEDEWNQMGGCQDHTAVHGVETSSSVIHNHLDYIPLETDSSQMPTKHEQRTCIQNALMVLLSKRLQISY